MPQHIEVPSIVIAQVAVPPACTLRNRWPPTTATGPRLAVSVPLPSIQTEPQHHADPSLFKPQAWP